MEEKYLKIIIDGLYKKYGYKIEDLSFIEGLSFSWGVVQNLNENKKEVIMFLKPKELFSIDFVKLKEILYTKLSCQGVEIHKVILTNKNEDYISCINQFNYVCGINNIQNDYIIIDYMENKILSYTSENTVIKIAEIMRYISYTQKERVKPYGTYIIIGINIIAFIITVLLSVDFFNVDSKNFLNISTGVLVFLGAKQNELIAGGQYYRLLTCMFLHGGIMHIALNMYSLYSLGTFVEELYGFYKYYIIYFISGITGSIFSYLFSNSVSVGASGAIFGLLGTALVFAIAERDRIGKAFLRDVGSSIAANFIVGLSIPNIDNFAHLGGFIGGVITAIFIRMINAASRNSKKAY